MAYLTGYLNAHVFALANSEERKYFPRYLDLSLNNELRILDDYKESISIAKGRKKSISNYASRFVKRMIPNESIIPHHPPFI